MADLNLFHVRPSSRHPKNLAAYDSTTHTYRADYVKPAQWTLELSFDIEKELQKQQRDLEQHLRAVNQGSGRPHGDPMDEEEAFDLKTAKLEKAIAELQTQISAHDFWFRVDKLGLSITHLDGTVSDHVASTQETAVNQLHPLAQVPQQGRYKVTAYTRRKTTPQIAPTQTELKFTLRDLLICTIGDSYACGEGNPDVAATPNEGMRDYADMGPFRTLLAIRDDMVYTPELELAQWQEPLAHRSYKSGYAFASEIVSGSYGNMKIVTTHMSFARSGAGIEEGLLAPNRHPRTTRRNRRFLGSFIGDNETLIETDEFAYLDECLNLGQVDEMIKTVNDRQIDFLLISIGGNDCGWIQGFVDIITFNNGITAEKVQDRVDRYIDQQLARQFIFLNDSLSKMPKPPRKILLTLYPKGFFGAGTPDNPSTNRNCGIFDATLDLPSIDAPLNINSNSALGIDDHEAGIIKQLAINLNNKLRECVALLNQFNRVANPGMAWHIVDEIDNDFEVHGYCASSTKFTSAETSFLTQGDWNGILHPNQLGQDAYGRRIADKIRAILNTQLDDFRPSESVGGLPVDPHVVLSGGAAGRQLDITL